MAGHSMFGLKESVVTSTGGRPVVPDTSFSQLVSCFQSAFQFCSHHIEVEFLAEHLFNIGGTAQSVTAIM